MSSRTPPKQIREKLRKEVNFGCPICRSLFLTWHHFDPPWHKCNSHSVRGIIALCSNCHRQADGGSFTKEQLHKLKNINTTEPPLGTLPWNVNGALIDFGGNYFVADTSKMFSLRVAQQEVFSLRLCSDGYLLINASIWNSKGEIVFQLEENDILTNIEKIDDLECTAQAKKLSVSSQKNDARLLLKFNRSKAGDVIPDYSKLTPIQKANNEINKMIDMDIKRRCATLIDSDGFVPSIIIEFKVHAPGFCVDTTAKGVVLDMTKLGYDRANLTGKFAGEHAIKFNYGNRGEIFHMGNE